MSDSQLSFDFSAPPAILKQLWTPDEIYQWLDAEMVAQFVEDRRVEHKSAKVNARDLGEYLSMWANTSPSGGLIFIGVDDDGTISGCSRMDQQHKNALENTNIYCEDARVESKEVPVKNHRGEDDFILVFRVFYRSDKLVMTSARKAFLRKGSTKIEIDDILKRELQIAKGEIHYELEAVPLEFPDYFDVQEVKRFCTLYSSVKKLRQENSQVEILELAKLGKRVDGIFRPNLAGCLLLAKDPSSIVPGSKIRIIRYEGKTEKFGKDLNSVYSETIEGPITKMIEEAKVKISSQLRSFQKLTSTGRLERRSEYPEVAWLEAIVNAVAHRSYNLRNQNIFVKLFDDRMVVESPGGFMPPTTPETVYASHNPRNPNLMGAMMYLELTFCAYEGTRRMRDTMVAAQLPEPKFIQDTNAHKVTVILENDLKSIQVAEVEFGGLSEEEYGALSREERYIINHLSINPSITVNLAAKLIERSEPTASKILKNLVERNIVNPYVRGRPIHIRPKLYSLRIRNPSVD